MRRAVGAQLGVLAALTACSGGAPTPGAGGPRPVVTRIDSSSIVLTAATGLGDPTRSVIRDSTEWSTFWAQAHALMEPTPAVPPVNFADSMLLVAALGTRSTGGYTVSFDSVARGSTLRAFVTTATPGPDCMTTMGISWPMQVVRVARFEGSVEFVEGEREDSCK